VTISDKPMIATVDLFSRIESQVSLDQLRQVPRDCLAKHLAEHVVSPAVAVHDELFAEAVFGIAVSHPNPQVRAALIDVVRAWLPHSLATDTLFTLVTDPDDLVCLKAMKVAGMDRVEAVADYLMDIAGRPSQCSVAGGSPVGRGAAHALTAVAQILGTDHVQYQHVLEEYLLENKCMPEDLGGALVLSPELTRTFLEQVHPGMTLISGGWSEFGLRPEAVPDKTFAWPRACPARKLWLPPYFIDTYPVTVADYDTFIEAIEATDHLTCHPLEPDGKIHRRNTTDDTRVELDHPVTGIDWFDAYAYARWAGKSLPTEYQWERAARGPESTVWPWGNTWNPNASNWVETAFGKRITSICEWRSLLADTTRRLPGQTTVSIHAHENHASGYGVVDLVGNAWEWTRSELKTGRYYSPTLHSRRAGERISVVIKGGAWSSLPGMMFPSYRGQDAPFCRHDEIGFRCVKQLPMPLLHEAGLGHHIRNTAIY
jgi:gamma-glutamyl hercynylcysteine S-oxide synthase